MDQRNISVVWEIIVNALKGIFIETENNPNLSPIYFSAHFWNNTILTWAESLALGM